MVKEKGLLKKDYRAVCNSGELVIERFFDEDMDDVGWKC